MKNKLSMILLIIIIVIGVFFIINKDPTQKNKLKTQNLLNSITNTQDFISTTITPINISSSSKEWGFNIVMGNHQIELNQDLVNLSILIDDKGREYKALKWEGSTGSHHREGILIFKPIKPKPKSILLIITKINNITREFNWNL